MTVTLGTEDFFIEMARALNDDPEWAAVGRKLEASMIYRYTEPCNRAFFMRFSNGAVSDVREVAEPVVEKADFVVSGAPDVWRGIFDKSINPTSALTRGKFRIKGRMSAFMQNMTAFNYIIDTMSKIDFE